MLKITDALDDVPEQLAPEERRRLGDLLIGIAHDANNPIGAMTMDLFFLRAKLEEAALTDAMPALHNLGRSLDELKALMEATGRLGHTLAEAGSP